MIRSLFIAMAGFAMAGIVGCATTGAGEKVSDAAKKAVEAADDATVLGDWELRRISKGKEKVDMPNAVTMTVSDSGNNRYTFTGFSGVNNFTGTLTIGLNGAIEVDKNIATTRMSGPADIMAAEQAFLDALKGSASWKAVRVGVETMEMYGEATLYFSRLSIKNRVFNLTAQLNGNGTAVVNVPEGERKVTLMIGDKASIFTGLNIVNTECVLDEGAHKVSFALASGAATLVSGDASDMERERLYLNNLANAVSYSVNGKELSLLDAKGKVVLVFIAQDLL